MKSWLVNTNSKAKNGNPNGYKYMLRQNKAATNYDKSSSVDKISKGDLVLLYHNENRIIAVGAVIKESEEHDFSDMNIEHWVDLNWLWKADFNNNEQPINSINRNDLNITMVNNSVVNITSQINYENLFQEICKRQNFI